MYVYKIENKINNKVYIGQSIKSINESKSYYGSGKLIQYAINKYGIDNFEKTILIECDSRAELDTWEIHYIDEYNSIEYGYNISSGGNGGNLGEVVNGKISNTIKSMWKCGHYDDVDFPGWAGYTHTDESKSKISKSQTGELGYWYGTKLTSEHKNKISEGTKQAFKRPEVYNNYLKGMRDNNVREKISKSLKGREPWNKGKTGVYTEDQLNRMSESAKNRKTDPDIEKIRRDKISKTLSENHPNKLKVIDNRTMIEYGSVKSFCEETDTTHYMSKKLRKTGDITVMKIIT